MSESEESPLMKALKDIEKIQVAARPENMHITCNQAVILLNIYRGTFGTTDKQFVPRTDMIRLEGYRLIKRNEHGIYEPTEEGNERVRRMLG